jgi:hypothetical protein
VFQKHVSSVSTVFKRMLQLLYLDISKVDRSSLHLLLHRLSCRQQSIHTMPQPGSSESEASHVLLLLSLRRRRSPRSRRPFGCRGRPFECRDASTSYDIFGSYVKLVALKKTFKKDVKLVWAPDLSSTEILEY